MSTPLAPAIVGELGQRLATFREAADASAEADDLEGAHRVRVTARRLHAGLLVWRPLLELPDVVRPRVLRRVERRFGARRDLEVLRTRLESLREAGTPLPGTIASLRARAAAADARGRLALRRRSTRRLVRGLTDWLAAPAWSPLADLPPSALLPWLVAPAASRAMLHPAWAVSGIPEPDADSGRVLHRLRRRLKGLRYRLECVADWYGPPLLAWLEELHAMQDALGAWHDEGVLLRMLARAGLDPACGATARQRAAAAMVPWPGWRQRYLDAGERTRRWADLGRPQP